MTTRETCARLCSRWIEGGWQRGDDSIVDELHAPGFVDRAAAGRASDREGFRQGIRTLYAAFPDFHAEIDDLVIDAKQGKAAIRWSARGTHAGSFMGVPPTGTTIAFQGIEILRIVGGKIAERWGEWNAEEILSRMGVIK